MSTDIFAPSTPEPSSSSTGDTSNPAPDLSPNNDTGTSIEETLRETYADVTKDDPNPDDPPKSTRTRNADGTFMPAGAVDPNAPPEGAPEEFADQGPPKTWKPEAKALWQDLPETLKREMYRREENFFNGISEYRTKAHVAETLWQEIAPFEANIRAAGVDAPGAIRHLMQTAATLQMGTPAQKVAVMRNIAADYGIDLATVFAGQHQQDMGFVDPVVADLQRRLAYRENLDAQREYQAQQQLVGEAHQTIESFASDPRNVYFPDVSQDMGLLLTTGRAATMQEAYDKACMMNTEVAKAIAHDRATATRRQSDVQRARRMGGQSVRVAPVPGSPVNAPTSLEESLRNRFRELTSEGGG